MNSSRRQFLMQMGAVALGFGGLRAFAQNQNPVANTSGYGPLIPDAKGMLDLPRDFSYTVLSRTGETMSDGLLVPGQHDGMAAFAGENGRIILVRNHEMQPDWKDRSAFGVKNELLGKIDKSRLYDAGRGVAPSLGGTTTLIYNPQTRALESHFLSLAGTNRNCAGGTTPWGSWISSEEDVARAAKDGDKASSLERDHGFNFEVPSRATGLVQPVALTAMGRFNHEAIAVDARSGVIYQTEDRNDGLFYRFIPQKAGELARGGKLQALVVKDQKGVDTRNWLLSDGGAGRLFSMGQKYGVEWLDVADVLSPRDDLRLVNRERGAATFARGEGIESGKGGVYFACTNGGPTRKGQIWRYVPSIYEGTSREKEAPPHLELFLEPDKGTLVENADNLTIAPWGDLVVCEDGSSPQFVVGITPEGGGYQIARNAFNSSEFAGATFAPDGKTLFVNVQTPGITYAIHGPWQ